MIPNRIYNKREINADISRHEMREMLYPCTKIIHFSFDNSIYIWNDGVVAGSSLGSILASMFMVELERFVISCLANK